MAPVNPLNPVVFDEVATKMTYAKLYPLIMKDFRHLMDCNTRHMPGNQQVKVVIPAGTGAVDSYIQGIPIDPTWMPGAQAKQGAYEAAASSGDILSKVTE
jgi:hypothetical protein